MEANLGFRGGAWIYRDRTKTSVVADRFSAVSSDGTRRWWGSYEIADEGTAALEPGTAYMRFSDGSDAQVTLERGPGSSGSFEVIGALGTLEPDMTRFPGTSRRDASAQDSSSDWPRPAGT